MTPTERHNLVALAQQAKLSKSKLHVTAGDMAELVRSGADVSNMVIADHPRPRDKSGYDPHRDLKVTRD